MSKIGIQRTEWKHSQIILNKFFQIFTENVGERCDDSSKEASEAEQDFNSESIELFVLLMFKDISIM